MGRALLAVLAVVLGAAAGACIGVTVGSELGLFHPTDDQLTTALAHEYARLSVLVGGWAGATIGAIIAGVGCLAALGAADRGHAPRRGGDGAGG
jgi:hypothetical protein